MTGCGNIQRASAAARGECPGCGSSVEGGAVVVCGVTVEQYVWCSECDWSGTLVWALQGVGESAPETDEEA